MSWEDRDYASDDPTHGMGRPGGDWQGMRPSFDNPFTWSITIVRIAGITIRVHVILLLYIVIMLLRAMLPPAQGQPAPIGFAPMAIAMAGLFVIVLAHELGHCLACRLTGGQADEILMWPLGGLAYCRPGNYWRAHFITAIGGPAVNVVICLIAGSMLGILTHTWFGVALPNPLTLAGLYEPHVMQSILNQALFLVNATSLILLLFNLMPVFPLDGGRIVQSLLWSRFGYSSSMRFAVRVGYVGAVIIVVFGAVTSEWTVVGIGLFGALTCYITQKQLQWTDQTLGFESDEYALSLHRDGGEKAERPAQLKPTRQERKAERQALQDQKETKEVDRILQKIATSGMDSLTRRERSLLERVTQRKRQQL